MPLRTMPRAEIDRVNKLLGIPRAPAKHPVYSEGPSITFSSHTQKPSEQKHIVCLPAVEGEIRPQKHLALLSFT